jgi:hypothetical protein
MSYNDVISSEEVLILLILTITSFIGSLSKDYIMLMQQQQRMKVGRITISTVTSTFLMYSVSAYIMSHFGFRGLIGISYLSGLLGFEILDRLSRFNDVIKIIRIIIGIEDRIKKIEKIVCKEDEQQKEENETKEKDPDNK